MNKREESLAIFDMIQKNRDGRSGSTAQATLYTLLEIGRILVDIREGLTDG